MLNYQRITRIKNIKIHQNNPQSSERPMVAFQHDHNLRGTDGAASATTSRSSPTGGIICDVKCDSIVWYKFSQNVYIFPHSSPSFSKIFPTISPYFPAWESQHISPSLCRTTKNAVLPVLPNIDCSNFFNVERPQHCWEPS